MVFCKKIKAELNLSASESSILRCLNNVYFISNQNMKKKPMLTRKNADRRLKLATEKVGRVIEWENEKKFNMSGLYGWCCYWWRRSDGMRRIF